jgi:hypothetical protein
MANRTFCTGRLRALLAVVLFLTCAAAHAQAINVTAANSSNDAIYSVNFSNGGGSITILNSDAGSLHNLTSLAFVTNPATLALDLLANDNGGQIVRYPGDFPPGGPTTGTPVYTAGGTGPANPDGLSVDAGGNVYLVNAKPGSNSNPQLWRFAASSGAFGTPALLDSNYGSSEVLMDTLVARADITPTGAQQPIVHAGDLLVLTSSPGSVLVYSGSGGGNGPLPPPPNQLLTPTTLITLPVGTIPGGLAFWPGDITLSGSTLLITTTRGTILQYDLAAGTNGTFTSGLGNGQFKVKTGIQFGTPYAYVANNNGGDILRFSAGGQAAGTITSGVQHPQGLAVTNVAYAAGNTCQTQQGCDLLGNSNQPVLTHNVPQLLHVPSGTLNGNVVEDICLVETDPRLVNGGTCTTSLPVSSVCGSYGSTATIPATLCGGSGPTGKGFALVRTLSQAYAQGGFPFNGILIFNDSSLANALPPSPNNPLCNPPSHGVTPHDTLVWAPLAGEGTVVEGTDMVELTSGCDGGASKSYGLSLFGLGLVLNVADGQPLADYTTAKYSALLNTISGSGPPVSMVGESPQVLPTAQPPSCSPVSNCIPTMAAPDGNFTYQLQQCIKTSKNAFANGSAFYDGAERAALAADQQVKAVATLAAPFTADTDYPNPSGALRSRLQNIYYTINTRISTNTALSEPPSSPPPPIAPTISGSPTTMIKAGSFYTFTPSAHDFANNTGTLTYSISGMPSWANFDTTTGTLSGFANPKGTYQNIVITTTDGCAIKSLAAFQIRVN